MKKRSNTKLSFFTKLLLIINCMAALALLIAYLAPVIDPRKFWPVAFFGLAYPLLLVTNLIFMAGWLIGRSKFALISLISILIGYNVLLDNIGFSLSGDSSLTVPNTIRFMTYNVHSFRRYGDTRDGATRHGILQIFNQEKPDVVGMQEFFAKHKGRYAMVDSVKLILNSPYYYFKETQKNDKESYGIALFSRFPIVEKGVIGLADSTSGNQCIYIDVKRDSTIIRFYSVHLQSIRFEPQDYQYIDTVTKRGKADLSSTRRLASKLKYAFLKRAEQVFKIKEHAAHCPYPYIIAGDFNDTPTSFAVSQMSKGIKNTFREKGFGLGRTYNGDFPNYQIDYIMADKRFEVLNYEIIKQKLSDHYPVYADLVLK